MNKNTSVTIRMDKRVKEEAQDLFAQLGMDMSTAINVFLKQSLLHRGLPFDISLNIPNSVTAAAIEEGRRIATDPTVPSYCSMDDLRSSLDEV